MRRDLRKEVKIGLLVCAGPLTMEQFFAVPEFIKCVMLGIGICFELIGLLSEEKYQRLKAKKKELFRFRQGADKNHDKT